MLKTGIRLRQGSIRRYACSLHTEGPAGDRDPKQNRFDRRLKTDASVINRGGELNCWLRHETGPDP